MWPLLTMILHRPGQPKNPQQVYVTKPLVNFIYLHSCLFFLSWRTFSCYSQSPTNSQVTFKAKPHKVWSIVIHVWAIVIECICLYCRCDPITSSLCTDHVHLSVRFTVLASSWGADVAVNASLWSHQKWLWWVEMLF